MEFEDNDLINKVRDRFVFSLIGKIMESEISIPILGYAVDKISTPILITFDNDRNEIRSHIVFETVESEPGHC